MKHTRLIDRLLPQTGLLSADQRPEKVAFSAAVLQAVDALIRDTAARDGHIGERHSNAEPNRVIIDRTGITKTVNNHERQNRPDPTYLSC